MAPPGKLLHVDGAAGLSGDMALGALVDLGVPLGFLTEGLGRLGLAGWTLDASQVHSHGIRATRVSVRVEGGGDEGGGPAHDAHHSDEHGHGPSHGHPHGHDHGPSRGDSHGPAHGQADGPAHGEAQAHGEHRTGAEIRRIIQAAGLPPRVETRALAVFEGLLAAEAAVHGQPLDEVVLHEAGAVDALVDVVGTCLGLEFLDVEHVSCSPPELGGGTVRAAHGLLPVPAPATLELVQGRLIRGSSAQQLETELLTPTGAALLAALARTWGERPAMVVGRAGYGAGSKTLPDRANVARFTLGTSLPRAPGGRDGAEVLVIEADIDDATAEILAAACDRLRELGALDAMLSPVTMKKGRAGTRITLLCREDLRDVLVDALFAETTTLGCRVRREERAECARETVTVVTAFGPLRVKLASWKGRRVSGKPEHDDCVLAARRHGVPLKDVHAAALAALPAETAR